MGDISTNFSRGEFSCHCGCGFDVVDVELIKILELIRSHWGAAVSINSAARCVKHNKAVNGSERSMHLLGKAADVKVKGVSPIHVYNFLNKTFNGQFGLGNYETFTHIDCRSNQARF